MFYSRVGVKDVILPLLSGARMAQINYDTSPVWNAWQRRELGLTRCQSCGCWIHLPKHICPNCWSDDVAVELADGHGHVVTYSLPRAMTGTSEPVVTAIVQLDNADGVRLLARLLRCSPAEVRDEMAVELTWAEDGGITMPAFAPIGASE
jgi:hypothetical protein